MLYCLPDFIHNYRSLLRSPLQPSTRPFTMTVSYPFQTVFAVPMTCDSCVKDVSDSLYKLGGITKVEANLKDQLLSVEGTAAPSTIVDAIQATGRDAILRGSGGSNSAAVSILESFYHADDAPSKLNEQRDREVRGLARMVQVSPTTTLIDMTLRGVAPGSYRATIREYGNLAEGASSTGPIWSGGSQDAAAAKGFLGVFNVDKDGRGSAYLDKPFQIWEVIGHAMVVSRQDESAGALKNDPDTLVGVIARSAGVWDNDKTVCSCTGKTLWEERKDEVEKGML
ncbi:heavy-metal-associated domain-containing protein [Colletotrichum cuscutae]|uniref:Superoxide dismutase 1 copper chaperone n=1 Tax=Colletotrichum cuscutae TaxID=1209917 RepID=A0AAI9VHL2_9PEZI|nr:heavy-metal-associated domain-containing protein [Colletotrichum cuscutae]